MTPISVLHEPNDRDLIISASGVPLYLKSSLETGDEILLCVAPDKLGWEILAQRHPTDRAGIQLVIRRY